MTFPRDLTSTTRKGSKFHDHCDISLMAGLTMVILALYNVDLSASRVMVEQVSDST